MKIESYSFTLSALITLGVAEPFEMQGTPNVTLRPRRVLANCPGLGFEVDSFKFGVVEAFIVYPLYLALLDEPIVLKRSVWYRIVRFFRRLLGREVEPDTYYPPLDLPVIGPTTPVRIRGRYDGMLPPELESRRGELYTLMVSILGSTVRVSA